MRRYPRPTALLVLAAATLAGCGKSSPSRPVPSDQEFEGSAKSISAADLERRGPIPIVEMLETRVPGLEVRKLGNGDFTLRILGYSSFQSNTEPLVVLNGSALPPGGLRAALGGLTSDDIEEIRVLKDATSAAIYGVRGANGVIEIRTKRPGRR